MEEIKISRKELYELVWSESMLSLSKKYNISDVGLRKKCKSLDIPIPNAGYWAKLRFGKRVAPRKPLGEFQGDQIVTLILREESDVPKYSKSNLLKQFETDNSLNLKVPDKLKKPDKLIVSVKHDLNNNEDRRRKDRIIYSSNNEIDIRVSNKNIGRALRIMDTLIKALKQRRYDIMIESGKSLVVVDGEKIPICCKEKLSKVVIKGEYRDSTEYQITGLLSIKIDKPYSTKEWVDGKRQLEDQLPNILAYLEIEGKRLKDKRIEREKYREEQREKERKVKAIQDRKEKELGDFKELFRSAKRHDNAEKIRRYANELEKTALSKNQLTEELKEKIEWIMKKADWYDPFIESFDECMQGIDRNVLKLKKMTFIWLNDK